MPARIAVPTNSDRLILKLQLARSKSIVSAKSGEILTWQMGGFFFMWCILPQNAPRVNRNSGIFFVDLSGELSDKSLMKRDSAWTSELQKISADTAGSSGLSKTTYPSVLSHRGNFLSRRSLNQQGLKGVGPQIQSVPRTARDVYRIVEKLASQGRSLCLSGLRDLMSDDRNGVQVYNPADPTTFSFHLTSSLHPEALQSWSHNAAAHKTTMSAKSWTPGSSVRPVYRRSTPIHPEGKVSGTVPSRVSLRLPINRGQLTKDC